MKSKRIFSTIFCIQNIAFFVAIIGAFNSALATPTVVKLTVLPGKVVNESKYGNPHVLFDEQTLAGDPLTGNGGAIDNNDTWNFAHPNEPQLPKNTWECGYRSDAYPSSAYVDLGKLFVITNIYLRDVNDQGTFIVSEGYPGNWTQLFSDNCYGYNSWNAHTINSDTTRYLHFRMASGGAKIAEIVVYGYDPYPNLTDTIAPNKIEDLKIDSLSSSSATLSWTAPGDNDTLGKAQIYEVRFSNTPITEANFLLANKVQNVPAPASGGTQTTLTVTGLQSGSPYYFAIRTRDSLLNVAPLSNIVFGHTTMLLNSTPYRIIIEPKMVLNEYALGDAFRLADEQSMAIDTAVTNTSKCTSYWNTPTIDWQYPLYATIDLGTTYSISKIYFYNSATPYVRKVPVPVYYGNPFAWSLLCTDSLKNRERWSLNSVNVQTRFLRFKLTSPDVRIGEIALYGSPSALPIEKAVISQAPQRPLIKDFMGVNTLINEPVGRTQCVDFLREYHDWSWNEGSSSNPGYPNNKIIWNSPWGGFNFDSYYANIKNNSQNAVVCIQGNVPWASDGDWSKGEAKPISMYESSTNPASYAEHANFMYQIAARYGNKTVADSLLQLESDQARFSGKNQIRYYEDWNEQDKNWRGYYAWFTPYDYAAMASADYDGHGKTISSRVGVKNADPDSKLVMGGLATASLDYLKSMKLWFDYNRPDSVIPMDVINVHTYSVNGTTGISPEEDNLRERMGQIVDYRNKYMHGKEVWISEFGYDTHPSSTFRAPQIGSCSQYETQARWLIRSYLELAAAGMDKAIAYSLADVDSTSSIQFSTCGLVGSRDNSYYPKTSWYYIYTMKNRLGNFRFSNEVASNNPNVRVYKFTNDSANKTAYAVWCPTAIDQTVSGFTLPIGGGSVNANLISLENGSTIGNQQALSINGSSVTFDVSEKPVFIITSTDTTTTAMPQLEHRIMLNPSMVVNESNRGDATLLVDEQNNCGDPLNNVYARPLTYWFPSYHSEDYPSFAYIDLGEEKDISKIYYFDSNDVSNITFSIGTPGNWTPLIYDKLDNYLTWRCRVVNIKTRYLRLTVYGSGNLNEIVLYGK